VVLVRAFDDTGAVVIALDLVSGQEVWQSSLIGSGNPGGIAVAGGRIWFHTYEAAGSRLVGLGPP
jgi:outer membrane protein assembly factor BamB